MWLVLELHKQFFETLKKIEDISFAVYFIYLRFNFCHFFFFVNVFLQWKLGDWDFDGPNIFKKYIDMVNLIHLSLIHWCGIYL